MASILRLPSTWLQIKVEVPTTPYYTILHDCLCCVQKAVAHVAEELFSREFVHKLLERW